MCFNIFPYPVRSPFIKPCGFHQVLKSNHSNDKVLKKDLDQGCVYYVSRTELFQSRHGLWHWYCLSGETAAESSNITTEKPEIQQRKIIMFVNVKYTSSSYIHFKMYTHDIALINLKMRTLFIKIFSIYKDKQTNWSDTTLSPSI